MFSPNPVTALKDRREAILQAMLELVAERGFHDAPMSLVAKRASTSAGIIYHYFPSKDELIRALYLHVKGKMSEFLVEGLFLPYSTARREIPRSSAHLRSVVQSL
jgi:AcrR family transcriptional regulator